MKTQLHRAVVGCLITLSLAALGGGQEPAKTGSSKARPTRSGRRTEATSRHEEVIRAAYEKLTTLNRAARFTHGPTSGKPWDESHVLQFELSNFRAGPIQEIWGALHSKVKTGYSGDIIRLTRSGMRHNNGPDHVAYKAQWSTGQYASIYDPQWTIGDLLSYEPDKYRDVGEYAIYDVTVSFEGRTRSYRALALFHNPYMSTEPLKPEFWDSIVGAAGALTEVWNEKSPPAGPLEDSPGAKGAEPGATGGSPPPEDSKQYAGVTAASLSETYSASDTVTDIIYSTTEDYTEHTSGKHGERVGFRGRCSEQPSNQQVCRVDIAATVDYENGSTSNWIYVHSFRVKDDQETATGPRGTSITCAAGRGIAVNNCPFSDCNFSYSFSLKNGNASMSGGNVWNGQLAHRHTCNLPSEQASSCTTQGFDGGCPPGMYPNAYGMCCPSGDGGGCIWPQQPDSVTGQCMCPDPPPTFFCEAEVPDYGGCPYYLSGCEGSPVLVDVAGDGFALTDPTGGVPFDLDGNPDGVRERISWTQAGSDDAWLALDRDGSGRIESGRELFGDYTAQPRPPRGQGRNGFLALSEYDRAARGGNADGVLDSQDAIFSSLRLWRDTNHDGASQAGELHALPALGISRLHLDYKASKRTDEYGNEFRYRAKVDDAKKSKAGRWAWDVFLVAAR